MIEKVRKDKESEKDSIFENMPKDLEKDFINLCKKYKDKET